MATHTLDATGLICPLPVLRARKRLTALGAGETLAVVASDPASVRDFAAFCDATGHRLLTSKIQDGKFHFEIQKTEA